jgi:hypothetical protein
MWLNAGFLSAKTGMALKNQPDQSSGTIEGIWNRPRLFLIIPLRRWNPLLAAVQYSADLDLFTLFMDLLDRRSKLVT